MGLSTDGILCFGIKFEEDFEFPWDASPYNGDPEKWHRVEVLGYKEPFRLWTDSGGYAPDYTQARRDEWYSHRDAFDAKNGKFPFELENYCSDECPIYILAIRSSVKRANRGFPVAINPNLNVLDEDVAALIAFCERWIEDPPPLAPRWYLASYMG